MPSWNKADIAQSSVRAKRILEIDTIKLLIVIRVTRRVCEKNRPKCIPVKTNAEPFTVEKESKNVSYFCHFQKTFQNIQNNLPIGQKSPNLVTLLVIETIHSISKTDCKPRLQFYLSPIRTKSFQIKTFIRDLWTKFHRKATYLHIYKQELIYLYILIRIMGSFFGLDNTKMSYIVACIWTLVYINIYVT
jgi:hypothetical protein